MYIKFNIKQALNAWQAEGGKTNFPDSLEQVLKFMQNDSNITNMEEASYLLATAKGESDYSLQRWESDFVCGPIGVPYDKQPCQAALDYYRATRTSSGKSKRNYFEMGLDDKGMPYFGRGLIQLTGKSNYQKYGEMIGGDLVGDGDKSLIPKNSYKIASTYLRERTFDYVNAGDLTRARKSVNGGTFGLDHINDAYSMWMTVFQNPSVNFKTSALSRTMRMVAIGTSLTSLAVFAGFYFFAPQKKNLLGG